jgi:DUF2946 family protein
MRRWLAIFLLLVLPLQFTWAAAATYCQHEDAATRGGHFGHHQHQHKGSAVKAVHAQDHKSPDGHAKLVVDDDCGYCHLLATKPVVMQVPVWAVLAGKDFQHAEVHPLGSRNPGGLERPDWRLA